MRALWLSLLLLAACGENVPPTIESLRLSNPKARPAQEFFVTLVGVEDPDGNVYAGIVDLTAEGEGVKLERKLHPYEASLERSRGDLIVGLTLTGDIPFGSWKLETTFEDEGGAHTDPLSARLTVGF